MPRAGGSRDIAGAAPAGRRPRPDRRCDEVAEAHRLVAGGSARPVLARHARLLAAKRSHLIGVWFAAPVCSTLNAVMATRSIDESFLARLPLPLAQLYRPAHN